MKKPLASVTAFILLACVETTDAADLGGAPPILLASPPSIWNGFYAGLNAGYAWDGSANAITGGFPVQTGLDNLWNGTHAAVSALMATGAPRRRADGALGGGQFGYNRQFDRFVIGAEIDIQGVGARGRGVFSREAEAGILGVVTDSAFSLLENQKTIDWLGTVRGRIGYLVTPTLLGYASAGLAYGGVTERTLISQNWSGAVGQFLQSSGATGYLSDTRIGWTVGGGFEWAFAKDLSAKAEYLYFDLGAAQHAATPLTTSLFGGLFDTVLIISRTRFDGHLARVGLNYHLNSSNAPTPASAPPPPQWSGFYAGLNGGYSWDGKADVVTSSFPVQTDIDWWLTGAYTGLPHSGASAVASTGAVDTRANGFVAGGQLGYNYLLGRFVAGLEADLQGAGLRGRGSFFGSASASVGNDSDIALATVESEKSLDWLGSVRGRVGYLANPALLAYATGGLAYGGVSARTAIFAGWTGNILAPALQWTNAAGEASHTLLGWTAGGGLEWAFTPQLSVKGEYLFYDLGDVRYTSSALGTSLIGFFSNSVLPISQTHYRGHVLRAGVNYHFRFIDGPPPVAASY